MCKILTDLKTLFEEKGKAKDYFTFRMLIQYLRKAISKFSKSYQINPQYKPICFYTSLSINF